MTGITHFKTANRAIIFLMLVLVWSVAWGGGTLARAEDDDSSRGAVYTLTNATTANAVAIYQRDENGRLTFNGTAATGGLGTGAGLGSQSPITLSQNGRWLFAVNAGSNSISVFRLIGATGLKLTDTLASGGTQPISLTSHDKTIYVLNAGGAGNISGFSLSEKGKLSPIANSTLPLSGSGVGPAQVAFSPNGKLLVVSEKATNKLDTYTVDEAGLASGPATFASAGTTPFGFAFDRDTLIVSEAFGGAVNASAASSYQVSRDGKLEVISASVPTQQTAACWAVVTPNGKFAYTANAGSNSVSGYRVASNGELIPLNPDGRTGVITSGSGPQDMAISQNGRFLYVIDVRVGKISGFALQHDGQLLALEDAGGLPAGSVGLAAR